MQGEVGRLLLWNTNGLVFNTGSQIWFVQSESLRPHYEPADLILTQTGPPPPAVIGSNINLTLTLINAGPGLATMIRVSDTLPDQSTVVGTTPSAGSTTEPAGGVLWNLGELEPGSNATLEISFHCATGGWNTNTATAAASEADLSSANNTSRLEFYTLLPPEAPGVFMLQHAVEDMIYDPARDRLLLSVGNGEKGLTNGLAVFNPYSGAIESFVPLGKKPVTLARSDDGRYLYVSLPDDALVQRFDLATLAPNLAFGLGGVEEGGTWYPFYASDLAVVPGAPRSLVAWRANRAYPTSPGTGQGIALFQNGIMASNVTAQGDLGKLEFDTDSGTLFGYYSGNLRRYSLDSSGVSIAEQYPDLGSGGNDIEYAVGHLFTSAGRLVQDQPFQVAWLFAGAENATLVEPDAASGRVFYLANDSAWQLKTYDIASGRLLGGLAVSNVLGTPASLIRWGTSGLAFRTSGSQIFVVRSPLVQTQANADLSLALNGPAAPVSVGSNAVFTIVATNFGPSQATGLQITNWFSPCASLASVSASDGTWTTNSDTLVWRLPALNADASATLSCTIIAGQEGVITATASASAETPDPVPGNNTAVRALVVGGPPRLEDVACMQLPANDMVWPPSLNALLLTANSSLANWSGSMLSVDPISLEVRFRAGLGCDAGRLAISSDDSVVCAGVDSGVVALGIPALTVTNRFPVYPADPRGYAYDLEIAPGRDRLVLVETRNRIDNSTGLFAYDAGVRLPNADAFFSAGLDLVFGDDPSMLFCIEYVGNGLLRYSVGDQGITLIDRVDLLSAGGATDFVWGNGRLYSSVGKVIDSLNRALAGTIAEIPAGSRVQYDAGSDRVFYLCPGVNQAMLKAFDAATLLHVGNQGVQGVKGSLGSFVRWGLDGFAVITSDGQLLLFRSSLVATNPPADVGISLEYGAPPCIAGSNITATITITNSGPNTATDVTWNDTLPIGTIITNATTSGATVEVNSNRVSGSIPLLLAGTAATINLTFVVSSTGIMTNQVTAVASSIDPRFTNNSVVAPLWLQPPTGLPATITLTLPVKDVERDPVRPLLYARFGPAAGILADSVAALDPINGTMGSLVRVGSDPGRMAASPDGQFLYVALDGAGTVQKLELPSLARISSFTVPGNQTAVHMEVPPVNPDMAVIRRAPDGSLSLHIDGVEMPGELSGLDLFAFSQSSGDLFGCDGFHSNAELYRLGTGTNGLSLLEGQSGKQRQTSDLKSSGNLLFFNQGMVVNPETKLVCAIMPLPYDSLVEPDVGSGRVFYLTPDGSTWSLRAFDIAQGIEVGAIPFPALSSAPRRLLRWGAGGLAFYNSDQLIILKGQLVPTHPPVDVVLKQSFSTFTAIASETFDVSLELTNSGPVTATDVVVTQAFALPVTVLDYTASLGVVRYTNNTLTWLAGSLPMGTPAYLTVNLRAMQPGTLTVSAAAYHSLNDVFWGNNAAMGAVQVLNPVTSNILQLKLASREIVYDHLRNVIYASTPASAGLGGDLIVVIDPATGQMNHAMAAGSEPGQLALSDDDKYLYVALDGALGVRRFDLESNTPDLSFVFGTDDIYFARDIAVQPGNPQTVAVSLGSYNLAAGYPSDVVLYDAGSPRLNRGGPSLGFTFASDRSYLFGYRSEGYDFVRMRPTADGLQTENVPCFTGWTGSLEFSNGRLYSYYGQVVDPYIPALVGSFPTSGPKVIDAQTGRAYYLAQRDGAWELGVFDLAAFQLTGTQTVANVQGTPDNLVRCGADRLAFRTSSDQLFIVRSPLVSTNSLVPADVVVTQQVAQDFTAPDATLRFSITITNRGPGVASNVVLAIKPPSPVGSLTLELPPETGTNSSDSYLCSLGSLPAGQSIVAVLNAVITNTASYSNDVSVSTVTPDPDFSNNQSLANIQGLYFQGADSVRVYPKTVLALAYDAVRQRLFAALAPPDGTNQIAWLDPQTGMTEGTLQVGITPTRMKITDDGQFLYISAANTGLVQRVSLTTMTLDKSFNPDQAVSVWAMATIPGNPHALALNYWLVNTPVTSVFDDGVERPRKVLGAAFRALACSTDGASLYGMDLESTGGNSPDLFKRGSLCSLGDCPDQSLSGRSQSPLSKQFPRNDKHKCERNCYVLWRPRHQ
ncbi:MAG: hypothetical protein M1608_14490 [Candidatus Omnitrophica bacterium]|nr:hypothetical protein [Candidatus Omnitrophota bacterium]